MPLSPLPIDEHLETIRRLVRERRALVVTAAPGAGKTTRVPPVLAEDGPVLLLQPRRVAARAIARRIADERGWTLGREVGWHVRFDRRASSDTKLLVATEGILTARLQQDPLLSDVRTVVIDEFHERSIHADLGLALARQTWLARSDFHLVVMSATLDAARVARFLDDCPVLEVPGRAHPVEVTYQTGERLERAVVGALPVSGAVLCFLPGAPEIRRASEALVSLLDNRIPVLPLHGGLDADEQDLALRPTDAPRVILATNLAETTLTVPDVRVVIDTGLHKVARYDADRAIDSLDLERISQDSADQRAGRAGRVIAGRAIRLWDSRDRLRPHREAEIARIDLAAVVLEVLAWGGDARSLDWFEAPPADAIHAAFELLRRLDAIDAGDTLTATGRALRELPLHPRLGRLLLAAGGSREAALACAILSERHFLPAARGATPHATTCDLLAAVDDPRRLPPHVTRVARDLGARMAEWAPDHTAPARPADETFRRAVLAAYPDRIAKRRVTGGDRLLLTSGAGARMGRESGVFDAEYVAVVDVLSGAAGAPGTPAAAEAVVRMATRIERDWLRPTSSSVEHTFDEGQGSVRAARIDYYGALVLREVPVAADRAVAAKLIAAAARQRGPTDRDQQLLRRLACAGIGLTFDDLIGEAAASATRLSDIDLAAQLPGEARRALDRLAPAEWTSPRGRRVRLDYRDDGRVVVAIRLQEMFGVRETPTIGRDRRPLTFELLAPNGRPVQITSDLKSFWETGYPVVRKELRGRYPKHAWPEL